MLNSMCFNGNLDLDFEGHSNISFSIDKLDKTVVGWARYFIVVTYILLWVKTFFGVYIHTYIILCYRSNA